MKKKDKENILDALEGYKEYEVSFAEECIFSKNFKAKSKDELIEKFNNGELSFKDGEDIIDGTFIDGSLEIEEVKEE